MKRWIAIFLTVVLLAGILSGCKKEEPQATQPTEELVEEFTPDDKMTMAICALARSVNAQKTAAKPVCYTVKGLRALNGVKTQESNCSYDNEKLFAVEETRYFEEENEIGSECSYTYVLEKNGKYHIISAKALTENGVTTKTYSILHTADTLHSAQIAWTEGSYGKDMTYQTQGILEDLILEAALSQGGAEAQVTSIKDFTLTITTNYKTETYTIANDYITRHVWTEMTTEGESEHTWDYTWNTAEATLPDLAEYTLITE